MTAAKKSWDRERRTYWFTCSGCGHKATTLRRSKARAGSCRNCVRLSVDPNQIALL